VLTLMGIGQILDRSAAGVDLTTFYLWAAGLVFTGLILVISAGSALFRLQGHPWKSGVAFSGSRWIVFASVLLIVVMPVVLVLGEWAITQTQVAWFLLPPLHLLAITIPIFWLLVYGLRGLQLGSAQRLWGVLGTGAAFGPFIILLTELFLMFVFLFFGLAILASQPGWADEILQLAQRLQYAPPAPEVILPILQPYMFRPEVLLSVFLFIAICVPLVEEILKPMGVWLLAGRRLKPAEGFITGLLSGAGYALFENLFIGSSAQQWAPVVLARAGTGVVHMFTTALVGWGLASAWSEGRYLRAGFSFAGAVMVHSLWNGLTLLMTAVALSSDYLKLPQILIEAGKVAPAGLGIIALGSFGMIWLFNRRLKHAIIHELS